MPEEQYLKNLTSFSDDDLEIVKRLIRDPAARIKAAEKSLLIFLAVYLNGHVEHPMAPFQHQLIALAEDLARQFVVVEAFRNSGKSTMITLAYAIWSILGFHAKKHVVIVSGTMEQAAVHMRNIRLEFEENPLLREDLGPFQDDGEWRMTSLYLSKYNARIMGTSWESLIRGIRSRQYRPDLIIVDDVESPELVKSREGRDKLSKWFTGDLIPMGDLYTRYFVLGTHLNENSLLQRLRIQIQEGTRDGIFRSFPILDAHGNPAWPGKFPSRDAVEKQKRLVADEEAWDAEFMLRMPTAGRQLVRPEWLRIYEASHHPGFGKAYGYAYTLISVDPAASTKENSDYSAIVVADVYRYGSDMRIYVTDASNDRLSFWQLKNRILALANRCENAGGRSLVIVESVATQEWLAQELAYNHSLSVKEWKPRGSKEDRLRAAAGFMEAGQFWLPEQQGKEMQVLTEQLAGFGHEAHDDLVDACSQLILYAVEHGTKHYTIPGPALELPPLPAERDEWKAKHGQRRVVPKPLSQKSYFEFTEAERKKLEREEDLRLMQESEARRSTGLREF